MLNSTSQRLRSLNPKTTRKDELVNLIIAHQQHEISKTKIPNSLLKLSAFSLALVISTLLYLSLSHLAHGIKQTTGVDPQHSYAMAIGIDLGFTLSELALILTFSLQTLHSQIKHYCNQTIYTTIAASILFNTLAFLENGQTQWYYRLTQITLGIAVPILIYNLTKVAAQLWIVSKNYQSQPL